MSTMFVIGYIGREGPFSSRFANVQEILNELTVFVAAYPLLTFTAWVSNSEDRIDNGWFLVGCICLNVLFNITVLAVIVAHKACLKCKFHYIRKRKLAEQEVRNR